MGVLPGRQGLQVLLPAAAADGQQSLPHESKADKRNLTIRASRRPADPHVRPQRCRSAHGPVPTQGRQHSSVVCHSKSALYVVSEPLTGERDVACSKQVQFTRAKRTDVTRICQGT